MAITEVGTPVYDGDTGLNLTVTHGLTIQSGDFVVAMVYANTGGQGNTITDNNGSYPFTTAYESIDWGGSTSAALRICYRWAGASEPSTYNWTFSISTTSCGGIVRVFRGVHSGTPWDVQPSSSTMAWSDSASTAVTTDMTIVTSAALGIAFVATDGSSLRYTAATNWGAEVESSDTSSMANYTRSFAAAGAIGTQSFGMSGTNDYIAVLGALRPASTSVVTTGLVSEHVGKLANGGTSPGSGSLTTWTDVRGYANGTLTGFTLPGAWTGDGSASNPYALIFAGSETDNYVTLGNGSSFNFTSTASWEFWMRCNTGTNQQAYGRLIDKRTSTPDLGWCFWVGNDTAGSPGYPGFTGRVGSTDYDTIFPAGVDVRGSWQQVVFIYDDALDTISLYRNGTAIDTISTQTGGLATNSDAVIIGNRLSDLGRWFDGKIATVRLYSTALSASQVGQNYSAGITASSVDGGTPSFGGMLVTRRIG